MTHNDFHYPFHLAAAVTAADVSKAMALDTTAPNTVKVAGDGDQIIGKLVTFENRVVEGIKVGNDQGRLVRRSAGSDRRPDAWAALIRSYENQHELKFEEGVLIYFEKREHQLAPNTLRQYAFAVRAMREFFEGKLLKEITPKQIREYMEHRQLTVSDATVKRELAFFSGLYSFLIGEADQEHLDNPVRKVNKRRLKEEPRMRYLNRTEYDKLLAACHSSLHVDIIKTAVLTGMRHGEMLDAQKSWVRWDLQEIHLPEEVTKGNKARIIPLSKELIPILEGLCADTHSTHLFSHLLRSENRHVPFTTFKNFFNAARTRAGLEDLRFHDLRHTFGSWWVQANGSLLVLKEIMGHSSVKVTERYAHLNRDTLHRVRGEVDRHTSDSLIRFTRSNPRRRKSE